MAKVLSAAAQRVQDALKALGVTSQVVELPESTRSAAEAAQAIGCRVEQIVKSLVPRPIYEPADPCRRQRWQSRR